MEEFGKEEIYNFVKSGSFGKFYSGSSFPIEYIQTSFTSHELEDLCLARDIRPPENIDFDLLIQRDVSEERVSKQIEPYLNPKKLTDVEKRTNAVFFPPLLVAIVPIEEKTMSYYYPDEVGRLEDRFLHREWPGLFEITYFQNDGPQSYPIDTVIDGNPECVSAKLNQAEIRIRLVKGGQLGAKLVVIDGQHRLCALNSILRKDSKLIENLIVPVCILYSPNSTLQKEASYKTAIPTVPEVFRHMFVDVNKTMELVGGHFNILLSDDSISSLACRRFCDGILKDEEFTREGLASIEWNTRTLKESTKIQRHYSLTSIGILDQALRESIGTSKYTTAYLLNLAEKDGELYPENEEGEHPKVEWNSFSLAQKNILDGQVKDLLIPSLKRIFFETTEYKKSFTIFKDELSKLLKECESEDTEISIEAIAARDQVLEYIPIGPSASKDKERARYKKFELAVKDRKEIELSPIIGYAIFQRAIFQVWADLLKIGRANNIEVNNVTSALILLLNRALANKGNLLSFEKIYMQHSVFDSGKIKPKNETKTAISNLIISQMGTKDVAKEVIDTLGIEATEEFTSQLKELGQVKASNFVKHYEKERKRHFKGNYRVDYSIDQDDREDLAQAEEDQKRHLKEVRDGSRSKQDVSIKFDELIGSHVKNDVELTCKALKDALNYLTDIVGYEFSNGDEDE